MQFLTRRFSDQYLRTAYHIACVLQAPSIAAYLITLFSEEKKIMKLSVR